LSKSEGKKTKDRTKEEKEMRGKGRRIRQERTAVETVSGRATGRSSEVFNTTQCFAQHDIDSCSV